MKQKTNVLKKFHCKSNVNCHWNADLVQKIRIIEEKETIDLLWIIKRNNIIYKKLPIFNNGSFPLLRDDSYGMSKRMHTEKKSIKREPYISSNIFARKDSICFCIEQGISLTKSQYTWPEYLKLSFYIWENDSVCDVNWEDWT